MVRKQLTVDEAHGGQDTAHLMEVQAQVRVVSLEISLMELHVLHHLGELLQEFLFTHLIRSLELFFFNFFLELELLVLFDLLDPGLLLGLLERVQLGKGLVDWLASVGLLLSLSRRAWFLVSHLLGCLLLRGFLCKLEEAFVDWLGRLMVDRFVDLRSGSECLLFLFLMRIGDLVLDLLLECLHVAQELLVRTSLGAFFLFNAG